MIKKITKVGNSHALIFDSTLMQLTHLRPGEKVNVEIHEGGTITVTPMERESIDEETAGDSARRLIGQNDELFRRLS